MKKTKPVSLHNIQTTSLSVTKKKSPSSAKLKVSKSPVSKKSIQTCKTSSQPEDYIIINDNIYSANTFTERNSYDQFLTKIKKDKQQTRKSFLTKQTLQQSQVTRLKRGKQSTKKKFKKLSPEDLIKCMTLDEKREMFYKLQSEITSQPAPINLASLSQNNKQSQPCSTQSFQHDISSRLRQDSQRQRLQKFHLLSQKLQRIKKQLIQKWQTQLEKLQDLFTTGRIGQKEKQNKKIIIEKLKDHKLKIIECTKTLFQKILQQQDDAMMTNNNNGQGGLEQKKNDKIQAILQSLHSLPSLQSLKDEEETDKQPNIDHLRVNNDNQKRQLNGQLAFSSQTSLQSLSERRRDVQVKQKNTHQEERNFNKKTIFDTIDITNAKQQPTSNKLNFTNTNNSLKHVSSSSGFGQIEQIRSIVNNNNAVPGIPSKSEQMLRELLDLGDYANNNRQKGQTAAKLSLKLDLRLDQIVFGQDEYSHLDKDSQSKSHMDQHNEQQQQHDNNNKHEISFDFKIDELMIMTANNNKNSYNQASPKPKAQEVRMMVKSDKKKAKKRSLLQFNEEDEPERLISSERGSKSGSRKQIASLTKISLKKLQENNVGGEKSKEDQQRHQPIISAQRNIVEDQSQSERDELSPKFQLSLPINDKPPIIQQSHQPIPLPQPIVPLVQPPSQPSHQDDNSFDQLQCHQPPHTTKPTIDIPLLLSKQKMQTLAMQQNKMFRQNIDKRIAFQMGCYQPQPPQSTTTNPHFTTLVDINSYIVGLYEFMMKKYMSSLVDSLNIPYGKSAIDKLYSLHTQGFVLEESYNQMNNILSEAHFKEYQREMMLTVRKCSEYETAHNRVVFEAFTKAINVYRPYYELEGEVFPWIVSQKGITFYEITQDNIQEVFQKSKIKVLQYCTSLCGIHPPSEMKNDQQLGIVNTKNEQNLSKVIKSQTLQQFDEWKIRFVNFDCLVRILVGKLVVAQLINQATEEFKAMVDKNQAQ